MDKNSNSYVMIFAVTMCVVLAIMLAGTFSALKSTMESNEAFDQNVNILIATGLYSRAEGAEHKSRAELEKLFDERIKGTVLEVEYAEVPEKVKEAGVEKTIKVRKVVDMVPTDHKVSELPDLLLQEKRRPIPSARKEYTTFFTRVDDQGKPVAYCIPIQGLGLWGTIYGYLALEPDLDTVKGITFYKDQETPGLGGEINKQWWQSQWPGKTIFDKDHHLVSVTVKKGKVDPAIEREKDHYVDGLSGATITSNGVTKLVEDCLEKYLPYFEKLKKGA